MCRTVYVLHSNFSGKLGANLVMRLFNGLVVLYMCVCSADTVSTSFEFRRFCYILRRLTGRKGTEHGVPVPVLNSRLVWNGLKF